MLIHKIAQISKKKLLKGPKITTNPKLNLTINIVFLHQNKTTSFLSPLCRNCIKKVKSPLQPHHPYFSIEILSHCDFISFKRSFHLETITKANCSYMHNKHKTTTTCNQLIQVSKGHHIGRIHCFLNHLGCIQHKH